MMPSAPTTTPRLGRALVSIACLVFAGFGATDLRAVAGVPDARAGASLLVPYFETGVDRESHPHDTVLTVHNVAPFPVTVHWTVWTPTGAEATSMSGSTTIPGAGVWSKAMRDLMDQTATQDDRDLLARGDFYRGFLTIDVVDEATDLNPFAAVYPFGAAAALEGYAYYARLGEGSANGLRMIPLEPVGTTEHPYVSGFYAANQNQTARERIDARARMCADTLTSAPDVTDCTDSFDGTIFRLRGRAFLLPALNGETRFVVFAWNTFRPSAGGPSAVCDLLGTCESTYTIRRFTEDGTLEEERSIRLDDVVTVVTFDEGSIGGIVSLRDVPDPDRALQVFTFAFNSAVPPGSGQNWDAIFEGVVVP